jgi:hypothetical protein
MTAMSAAAIGLELWVWYDGQALTKQQVLSRLYFSISDLLAQNGIKTA